MSSQTRMVMAICQGTVIDHVQAGQGINVVNLLGLAKSEYKITIGINLASADIGRKDIIKISDHSLLPDQVEQIGVFAPQATVNFIENYEVKRKIQVESPSKIRGVFSCPNDVCITYVEPITTLFYVQEHKHQVELRCHYCERIFPRTMLEGSLQ